MDTRRSSLQLKIIFLCNGDGLWTFAAHGLAAVAATLFRRISAPV